MDSQQLAGGLALYNEGISVRDFKAQFSRLVQKLAGQPIVVKSNGNPIAVLVDIREYQQLLERAESNTTVAVTDIEK